MHMLLIGLQTLSISGRKMIKNYDCASEKNDEERFMAKWIAL